MEDENDVLLRCQGETLLKLASRLKEDLPYSTSVHNTLLLHHRGHCSFFTFYQLRHHQESSVILYKSENIKVGLYCKKDELHLLEEALKKTRVLDWNSNMFFYHVIDYIVPTLSEVAFAFTGRRLWETVCDVFTFDTNTNLEIKSRADAEVSLLGRAGVKLMYDTWMHNYSLSEDRVQQQCLCMPAVGVYLTSDTTEAANDSSVIDLDRIARAPDESLPVSWACMCATGSVGLLQTEKEHLRKGYGSMVVQACSMLMVKEGYYPHAHVGQENDPSTGLFRNLEGWKATHKISWIGLRSK